MKKIQQVRFFDKKQITIFDNKLSYVERSYRKESEIFVPFEELMPNKESCVLSSNGLPLVIFTYRDDHHVLYFQA